MYSYVSATGYVSFAICGRFCGETRSITTATLFFLLCPTRLWLFMPTNVQVDHALIASNVVQGPSIAPFRVSQARKLAVFLCNTPPGRPLPGRFLPKIRHSFRKKSVRCLDLTHFGCCCRMRNWQQASLPPSWANRLALEYKQKPADHTDQRAFSIRFTSF